MDTWSSEAFNELINYFDLLRLLQFFSNHGQTSQGSVAWQPRRRTGGDGLPVNSRFIISKGILHLSTLSKTKKETPGTPWDERQTVSLSLRSVQEAQTASRDGTAP